MLEVSGIIRRNFIDSNSYNFSGGGGDVNCEKSLLTFKPWLRCVCKVHVVSMLRLAMMAFRRSPRGHDWSVVGQAEKVLLWAFYSTDQANARKLTWTIFFMFPSNQISSNKMNFTWIEWMFCLSAGIIWGWKNKRQKGLANRLFGLFESTKKNKKVCEFQKIKHGFWHF